MPNFDEAFMFESSVKAVLGRIPDTHLTQEQLDLLIAKYMKKVTEDQESRVRFLLCHGFTWGTLVHELTGSWDDPLNPAFDLKTGKYRGP